MNRIYDFDELEKISEALGMCLYEKNGCYIDRSSAEDEVNRDGYFNWELVKMLDKLPDSTVVGFVVGHFEDGRRWTL